MSQGLPNPGFMQEKVQKGDFPMMKKKSTHFSDSTHQECMVFARIGHGSCYYHWIEIFAGVTNQTYWKSRIVDHFDLDNVS